MRLKSRQQLEDLGVANYIALHVWTLALGGIYHGDKFVTFAWQRKYFEYVWNKEILNKISQKDGYLHCKFRC